VQISINVHMRVDRPYPCARLRIKNQLEIESFKRIESTSVECGGCRSNGFSLIELLVVVLIVSILSFIGIREHISHVDRTARKVAFYGIRQAVEACRAHLLLDGAARDFQQMPNVKPISCDYGLVYVYQDPGTGIIAAQQVRLNESLP